MCASRVKAAALTHKGPVRDRNEDYHLIDLELGLILVSDGMGGHRDGDVASRTASALVRTHIACASSHEEEAEGARARVHRSLTIAHSEVRELNSGRSLRNSMGTTIVGLYLVPAREEAILFHVGDSRAYLWQSSKLTALTRDHSAHEAWLQHPGTDPEPKRNVLLQAIGVGPRIVPTLTPIRVSQDDIFLLCTDGVTDALSPLSIERVLADVSIGSLQHGCQAMLEAALAAGARDNVTAALVAVAG